MIHELKIEHKYFEDIRCCRKKFEIRRNDRNFLVGDFLALNELNEAADGYTGRSMICKVIYIVDDERFCKDGFVVMGINPFQVYDTGKEVFSVFCNSPIF